MDEQARESAFMSALVTEHFVLQSAASTTVSEASGRASLYLSAVSSSLIAMGFAAQSADVAVPFIATVIPVIVVMGVFTVVRLVDTGVQNIRYLAAIADIRGFYRTLTPDALAFFVPWSPTSGEVDQALASLGVARQRRTGLFTMASMIATINSIVAGAGVALAHAWVANGDHTLVSVLLGLAMAAASFAAFFVYQDRRYRTLQVTSTPTPDL